MCRGRNIEFTFREFVADDGLSHHVGDVHPSIHAQSLAFALKAD